MDRAEKATGSARAGAVTQVNQLAAQLDAEAAKAAGRDAARLKGAADAMKARASQIK
jgi:hypothetical protein